jgi:hypothetical protein
VKNYDRTSPAGLIVSILGLIKALRFYLDGVIYHTIRQLRLVDSINSKHARINLFYLQPLQAFSRLTASTASGLVIFVYRPPTPYRHRITPDADDYSILCVPGP